MLLSHTLNFFSFFTPPFWLSPVNIYNYNMVKIAQMDVSILADDNYWNQIKSAFISRGISIDGEKLYNSVNSINTYEQNMTSVNDGRENIDFNEINNTVDTSSEDHLAYFSEASQNVSTSRRRKITNSSRTNTELKPSINQNEHKGRRLEL